MKKVWNEGILEEKDIITQLLKNRGIEGKVEIENFLNPRNAKLISPFLFSDMTLAVERVKKAVAAGEHILIWGDFDADGVSSTALLYKVFTKIGANFSHFIPNREEHGHGLNSKELVKIVAKKKLKLLITVDCGISDNSIISMLKGLGVDTIITDHHRADKDLPEAFAIINPRAQGAIVEAATVGEIKSLCDLAGVGVAYKFASAVLDAFSAKVDDLLPLVALGTIADVVPLLGENRTLVALGLDEINKKTHKGIKNLLENLHVEGNVNAESVAFLIAPRINAAGRLSTPDEAFNLLIAESDVSIDVSIQKLNHYNSIRQTLCDEVYSQCLKKIDTPGRAIMLFDDSWHVGIIGIVASRLVETFGVPVFLATKNQLGQGRCSIRSILPFNVYEILKENANLFLGFGGHSLAGGFSFEGDFEQIKDAILNTISQNQEEVQSTLEVAFELKPGQIDENLVNKISTLEPFGQGNPYPVFSVKNAALIGFRQVGKDGSHLKFEVKKDNKILNCVWWKKSQFLASVDSLLDIAFCPKINTFNGNTTVQLDVVDVIGETQEIKIYDHRQKATEEILSKIDAYVQKGRIKIFAKKITTREALHSHSAIYSAIENEDFDEIMFFDYPDSENSLKMLLKTAAPAKIHLMREEYEQSPAVYIDNIFKMAKFAHNKKSGAVDFEKMADLLGVSVDFVKITLEFLQNISAINIVSEHKIELLAENINFDENFFEIPLYEILLEELNCIFEFKNRLMTVEADYFRIE